MKRSLQKNKLPQTYGLFLNGNIIGMFQFTYGNLSVRPHIYPLLANVYIDQKYSKMRYDRRLLEGVKKTCSKKYRF